MSILVPLELLLTSGTVVCNATERPDVLVVVGETVWDMDKTIAPYIKEIAKDHNLSCSVIMPTEVTWDRIKNSLTYDSGLNNVKYLFMNCHGYTWYATGTVTQLRLSASKTLLFAKKLYGMPESGEVDSTDPDGSQWRAAYATELNRSTHPFKFVWMEACHGGQIGAARPGCGQPENHQYYGKYGKWSCFEYACQPAWNDMAASLGITAQAALETQCGYVSYFDLGWSARAEYCGGVDDTGTSHAGIIRAAWSLLSDHRTFQQIVDTIYDNHPYTRYNDTSVTVPTTGGPCEVTRVAPFYNWRFWGNANVSLF